MGRSPRVALPSAAVDGSELHRIKSGTRQSRDGHDGIAGREFSFATRADPGKESHADSRGPRRTRCVGEFACGDVAQAVSLRRKLTVCVTDFMSLQKQIEELASRDAHDYSDQDFALCNDFKAALNRGEI